MTVHFFTFDKKLKYILRFSPLQYLRILDIFIVKSLNQGKMLKQKKESDI